MAVTQFIRALIARPQLSILTILLVLCLGAFSLNDIPKAENPVAQVPGAGVSISLPGADAAQMENLVILPIERQLGGLEDVYRLVSTAVAGNAEVSVAYNWGEDPQRGYDEFVSAVNSALPDLPSEIRDVRYRKFDTSETAIVQVPILSDSADIRLLKLVARRLKDEMERLPTINKAEIWGVPQTEISIELNVDRLTELKLSPQIVRDILMEESQLSPLGYVVSDQRRFNIQSEAAFFDLEDIRNVVVRSQDGRRVYLRDIADVKWANVPPRHYTRFNNQRAIFVTAKGNTSADMLSTQESLRNVIERFEVGLPDDIKVGSVFEQSRTIDHRLGVLKRDFFIAMGLVILTLLPLGFRASTLVMIAIPLSLAIGITVLYWLGFTLNQISITGFVLSLGLLVDDSIVVVENITRHARDGASPKEAAINGVKEINIAVFGCTATLILAFLPLMFLPEVAGEFIRGLPVAVTVTVLASLLVSITVVPFLASFWIPKTQKLRRNIAYSAVTSAIDFIYGPALRIALKFPKSMVLFLTTICLCSFLLVPKIGFSLFPKSDAPYFLVDIEAHPNSSLEFTDNIVQKIESDVLNLEGVVWTFANAGSDNPQIYFNETPKLNHANSGQIFAAFDEFGSKTTSKRLSELQEKLSSYAGVTANVKSLSVGQSYSAPIVVRIRGDNPQLLLNLAEEVETVIKSNPHTWNIKNPLGIKSIDFTLDMDYDKLTLLDFTARDVETAVRMAVSGEQVGYMNDAFGDRYPVKLTLRSGENQATSDDLRRVRLWNANGNVTPLMEVADVKFVMKSNQIDRWDFIRTATVTANVAEGESVDSVTSDIGKRLSALALPPGYDITFGGEVEASKRSFGGLGAASVIALFGVLIVLLMQFRTLAMALTVFMIVPFGIMGGIIGLYVTGYDLSFVAAIGFVALVGIEIKNSILLVDFANALRAKGVSIHEAAKKAAEIRFFPVLLTALTAIGGLMPLAIEGGVLLAPLAIVIIGGLASSTFLSRIVTPALYVIVSRPSHLKAEPNEHKD